MTDADYEAICRRWKTGLEDVFRTIHKAHEDGQFTWMERALTAGAGSALGFTISADYLRMSAQERQGFMDYLDRAELKVS